MVLVIGLLMTTTTGLDIRRQRAIFREELRQEALLLAGTLNYVFANPRYFADVDEVQNIARLVLSQRDIRYMKVFLPDGRILMDSRQAGNYPSGTLTEGLGTKAIERQEAMLRFSDGLLEVASPILSEAELFGGVQMGFSTAASEAEIREFAWRRIWQTLGLMVIGVLLSYGVAQY